MSLSYKVLGQANPATTTVTTLYTSAGTVVISTLVICNQASSSMTYRIAVKPTADALSTLHYIAYNAALSANETIALTLGITMAGAENIIVYSSNSSTSFNLFGTEIS